MLRGGALMRNDQHCAKREIVSTERVANGRGPGIIQATKYYIGGEELGPVIIPRIRQCRNRQPSEPGHLFITQITW